jgi:hypothetical protein
MEGAWWVFWMRFLSFFLSSRKIQFIIGVGWFFLRWVGACYIIVAVLGCVGSRAGGDVVVEAELGVRLSAFLQT